MGLTFFLITSNRIGKMTDKCLDQCSVVTAIILFSECEFPSVQIEVLGTTM